MIACRHTTRNHTKQRARRQLLTIEFDSIVGAMTDELGPAHIEPTFDSLPYDIRDAIRPKFERSNCE